jgi:hypothetical protein
VQCRQRIDLLKAEVEKLNSVDTANLKQDELNDDLSSRIEDVDRQIKNAEKKKE